MMRGWSSSPLTYLCPRYSSDSFKATNWERRCQFSDCGSSTDLFPTVSARLIPAKSHLGMGHGQWSRKWFVSRRMSKRLSLTLMCSLLATPSPLHVFGTSGIFESTKMSSTYNCMKLSSSCVIWVSGGWLLLRFRLVCTLIAWRIPKDMKMLLLRPASRSWRQ